MSGDAMTAGRLGLHCVAAAVASVVLALPVASQQLPAGQQSPSVLREALQRQAQRLQAVDAYVERIRMNEVPDLFVADPTIYGPQQTCRGNCVVYKVEDVQAQDGTSLRQPRALSPLEVQELAGLSPGADFLELFGAGLIDAQQVINVELGWDENTSLLRDLFGDPNWETQSDADYPNPSYFNAVYMPWNVLAAGGFMMIGAAQAIREADQSLATSADQAQAEMDTAERSFAALEEMGQETTPGGRTGTRVGVLGLNMAMPPADGQEVFMNSMSILIDNNDLVILSHRVDGTMVGDGGSSRPFFIEVVNSDFRNIPGCDLYEPYRRDVRMGGMLDDEQMADVQEASEQLAEFEAELAAMPPAQRQMMESMVGPQIEQMRSMANGGAIEHTQEIEEIICNPDLAALFAVPGVSNAGPLVDPTELLIRIQTDLATLGYSPGNMNGVLDVLTEVAISQYQAERGIVVDGQPSGALAAILAREASGQ